jgi:hypothetical protein
MKIVKESLIKVPSWEELVSSAPEELQNVLKKCEETHQSGIWHPEAPNAKVPHNVLAHIRLVYDRASATGDINLAIAAFFHDLGKADTTAKNKRGGWSAHGHENVSARLVNRHAGWVEEIGGSPAEVEEIVGNHMRIKQMEEMRPAKQDAMKTLNTYDQLLQFTKCDDMKTLTDEEMNRYR